VEVVRLLALEHWVAHHEVVERGGVVREVDPLPVALRQHREDCLDPSRIGVEVLDVEAIPAEVCAALADPADVVDVVRVADVGEHDLLR